MKVTIKPKGVAIAITAKTRQEVLNKLATIYTLFSQIDYEKNMSEDYKGDFMAYVRDIEECNASMEAEFD